MSEAPETESTETIETLEIIETFENSQDEVVPATPISWECLSTPMVQS